MLKSFFRLLTRCYRLALPYGRFRLFAVLGLIFLNGLIQLVGVTSVFPFFAVAADPERIRKSGVGVWMLGFLPPLSHNDLLVLAGSFAIGMLVVASVGSILSEVLRIRYAYGFSHWLRGRVLRSYAAQPYSFFLRRNSAELNQRLLDILVFTQFVLLPVGEVLTRVVLVLFFVGALILVQPWIALGATVVLGGFYLAIFLWLRPRTRLVADGLQKHNLGFSKNSYQFLHGIKSVLVHGKSEFFMQKAMDHSAGIGRFQGKIPLYTNGPRYLIEPIAFGGLVAIVVVLALKGRPFSDILPNLSVMALAGARLLPSLQMLYGQLVIVASNNYTLNQVEEELFEIEAEPAGITSVQSGERELSFERDLQLDGIHFQYPGAESTTLEGLNLTVSKNESVGIAGPSGSGKSTLVDLILGLHTPTGGRILVDGVPLSDSNKGAWRRSIGYVPQDIYLLDDTIEANIAFGVDPADVDAVALQEAAQGAQIFEFIEKELPKGFQTEVGERGVRLSGGQRQRIGLARALYNHPQILILDEATSALDVDTEIAVMKTIELLKGKLTLITVAHRLVTLENCNRIITLK